MGKKCNNLARARHSTRTNPLHFTPAQVSTYVVLTNFSIISDFSVNNNIKLPDLKNICSAFKDFKNYPNLRKMRVKFLETKCRQCSTYMILII